MTQPHWQAQLDRVKQHIEENPIYVDIDVPDEEKVECQATANLKGWQLAVGMYRSGREQCWMIVATLDPIDRSITDEDHQFLPDAAVYLGADEENLRIMLDPKDRKIPTFLMWSIEN